jgi:hypothetical protein
VLLTFVVTIDFRMEFLGCHGINASVLQH